MSATREIDPLKFQKTFLCYLVLVSAAWAGEPSKEHGAILYKPCATCHGPSGIAVNPDAPNLAHQPALALTYQLIQFREGQRIGGGMDTVAKDLTDQDARDLSAYLYSLPARPSQPLSPEIAAKGQAIERAMYCNSCHGENLEGQKHVPRLAGQKQSYLVRQLSHFKTGERIDLDGSMENAVMGLDAESIESISAYAASR